MSELINMVKRIFVEKIQILYSSDHSNLFEFRQVVINIIIKELLMVFWTVSNSNGNMEGLTKFSVKSWCSDGVFHITVVNADIGILKCHIIP